MLNVRVILIFSLTTDQKVSGSNLLGARHFLVSCRRYVALIFPSRRAGNRVRFLSTASTIPAGFTMSGIAMPNLFAIERSLFIGKNATNRKKMAE